MSDVRGKALVLGHDTRSFLSVIRSLGRGGVEVHVAWHRPAGPAARSRYIVRAHNLPPYTPDGCAWKEALIDLLQREAFDLVVPCDDPSLLPLHRERRDLEKVGRLAIPSERAVDALFDKVKTAQLARTAGVPVPREMTVSTLAPAGETIRSSFSLPVVLKPRTSFDPAVGGPKQAVRKAYSWDEMERNLADMLSRGPVAVQENVPGTGVGVELLSRQGEPLLVFQHQRVHEPLHGGGSSYRKSVPLSGHLVEASLKLLKDVDYTGVAMVEFKVDPRSGTWFLMEVNARFWGSLPLALAAGADFPLALYELLVENRTSFPRSYRTGLYARNLRADAGWQWSNLKADRSDPTLATRSLPAVIGETALNALTLRERSDTLSLDDPGPGIAELGEILSESWSSLTRPIARRYLSSEGVRRRLAHESRQALEGAGVALFACKGNVCRSPFAEALAGRSLAGRKEVLSAGYYPQSGRPVPPEGQSAARRWHVDLSGHRSRVLTAELVSRADVIFVFDRHNRDRVLADFPGAKGRVHYVGALKPGGPLCIDDPWGQDEACFDRVYHEIAAALEAGGI